MRWHLDFALLHFVWFILSITISLEVKLSQAILESWSLALNENVVSLVKESKSKVSQSNLNDCPVVVNFVDDGLSMNDLRKLTLHEQILCFSYSIVDGVMIALE